MLKDSQTVFMSCNEGSEPHQVYLDMKAAFWSHHIEVELRRPKHHRSLQVRVESLDDNAINYGEFSDNESNVGKSTGVDSRSSTDISTDKRSYVGKSIIPVKMDIATQFNSEMNIQIEQNSTDSSLINIKFEGPIHGKVEGTGNMARSNFLNLINEKITNQVINEISKSNINAKVIETLKINPPSISAEKEIKNNKHSSLGSEESINYFASALPTQSVQTSHNEHVVKLSKHIVTTSKALSDRNTVSNDRSLSTSAQYNAPFSHNANVGSAFPSYGSKSENIAAPAVLPKCITRRIAKAMVNDLSARKKSSSIIFDLEKKIALLPLNEEIRNQNWHAAIKRGRIMIGEIIELIITVNIDKITKKIEEIESIFGDLKSELINSVYYLLSLINENEKNDILCLQLIIDIVTDEISKLKTLAEEWIKEGCKSDFSSFFINKFTKTFSPNNSEFTSNSTESKIENISKTSEYESKYVTETKSRTSQQKSSSKDHGIIPKTFNKLSKSVESLTSKMIVPSNASKENKSKDELIKSKNQLYYPDPSIITNSRVKKTMNSIMQVAVDEKITNVDLPTSMRTMALPVKIINEQPIITRNANTSLIKELVNINEKWNKPVEIGKVSIRDLIEFIINTIAQDKESSKELYEEIVEELMQLENEMLFSLANNLYVSRNMDQDLISLCYEILAELIFDEMAVAKYIFKALDKEAIQSKALPLGKLYRNYVTQPDKHSDSIRKITEFKSSENYAHQTSEVKNYANISIDEKEKDKPRSMADKTDGKSKQSKHTDDSNVTLISKIETTTETTEKTERVQFTKGAGPGDSLPIKTYKESETMADHFSNDETNALRIIIDKLNNQTKEINKIKENLQNLTGKVDEKFSQWKCNFSLDKVNEYCSHNSDKVNLVQPTKMYSAHEIIHPNETPTSNLQPSVYTPVAEMHLKAKKTESTSYIAPISNKTREQVVRHKINDATLAENLSTEDILNLIGEGSLNLLNNRNRNKKSIVFERRDSCKEINVEFDKIFEWVVVRYEETRDSMLQSSQGKDFINSMNNIPLIERRKIEKDLIGKIIEENNIMINNWVKEICYKRLLNCLTPLRSK